MKNVYEFTKIIRKESENEMILFKLKHKTKYLLQHRFTMTYREKIDMLNDMENYVTYLKLNSL